MRFEFAWVASGQILSAVGSLIVIRLTTESLRPDIYGEMALLLTVSALVTQVLLGGVNAATSRHFAIALELGQTANYLNIITKYADRIVIAGVLLVATIALGNSLIRVSPNSLVWIICFVFALISGVNSIINGVINTARKRIVSAIHQVCEIWLRIPLLFTLLFLCPNSTLGVLLAFLVTSIIIALSQRRFLLVLAKSTLGCQTSVEPWEKKIIKYALPYIPWTFLVWVQQASDRWALEYFSGHQAVGIYAVIFQIGFSSLSMLFTIGIRFVQPIVYQHASTRKSKGLGDAAEIYNYRLIMISVFIAVVLFLITTAFHHTIFSLLVNTKYREFSYLLPWMVASSGLFGISEILSLKMQSDMHVRRLSAVKSVLGLIGVLFSVLGAAYGGLDGVVLALVLFNIMSLVAMAVSAYAQ